MGYTLSFKKSVAPIDERLIVIVIKVAHRKQVYRSS